MAERFQGMKLKMDFASRTDWLSLRETMTQLVAEAVRVCPGRSGAVAGERLLIIAELPLHNAPLLGVDALSGLVESCKAGRSVFWRAPSCAAVSFACGEVLTVEGQNDQAWQACQADMERQVATIEQVLTVTWGDSTNPEDEAGLDETPQLMVLSASPADVRWFGGTSFDSVTHTGAWRHWPSAWFFVPQFELRSTVDTTWLRVNVLYTHQALGSTSAQLAASVREQFTAYFLDVAERPSDEIGASQRFVAPVDEDASGTFDNARVAEVGLERLRARESYEHAVCETARDISNGRFEKLVLARCETLHRDQLSSLDATVTELSARYPDAFVYAVRRGRSVFIGASPERLVAVADGRVSMDCLAGTAPRGETPPEDDLLARQLLASPKNRQEHEVVLGWITKCLRETADDVEHAVEPVIRKLANVQHLYTPVQAWLRPGVRILDLVRRLHPTPAVAGRPLAIVLPIIREREQMDRGWYAGAVGIVDGHNNGEFCVSIRSALVTDETAWLYAGAGIMQDSDAAAEWAETVVKMQAMLRALTASRRTDNGFG